MKAAILLLTAIPAKHLMITQPIAQTLPFTPDVRGLLDFGVTAVVAVFMIWVYSRQVGDWQKQFLELSKFHASEMTKLVERYDKDAVELREVIAENNLIKGKLLEAVERMLRVYPCPYANNLDDHPIARLQPRS